MDNLKKKAELSINVVIIAVICLLVLIVLVFIFTGRLKIFNSETSSCRGTCYLGKDVCESTNTGPCYHIGKTCVGSDGKKLTDSTSSTTDGNLYCGVTLGTS